jgi:predicted lysophospholipase L1 biosynthesis ABC-type transport system permease subunit
MLYEPMRWKASVTGRGAGCKRLEDTIVDDYGAVGGAAAVCALLDSMVALVRRLADVVSLGWSGRRRIATALRL